MTASSNTADDDLLQITCSVCIGGQLKGTGWLIDEQGYIVTAGHVLGTVTPVDDAQVAFLDEAPVPARRVHWSYDRNRGVDCAVLAISPPPRRKPLPLSLARNVAGAVKLYGFGKTLVDLSAGHGVAIGPFHPSNRTANRLFALETQQTREQGYSGAAVYSEELGAIVGIQIEGTTVPGSAPQGTTVLAMPLYRIAEEFPELQILSALKKGIDTTNYWYHVYLSYDRGGIQEMWVEQFLKDELSKWLQVELAADAWLFSDHNPKRKVWDKDFMEAIRRSFCLVPVLTPSYWRSSECLAELESFQSRQNKENVAIIYGVLFSEEGAIPDGIRLPFEDFTELAYVYNGFRNSERYGTFQDKVKNFAKLLASMIRNAPDCESSWPISLPSSVSKPAGVRELRIERPRL
jgi:hypothetical protein